MNFYSLDGTKIDSNNLFENKLIYERFDNTNKLSSSLDNVIDDNEEFVSVPTTKSSATDNNYQCSDGYNVKGTTLGNDFMNSNFVDCKKMCESAGTACIGFNFDTSKNICTLKKDASSLMDSQQSSTLCIKKSSGNTNSKVGDNKAFNQLDSIFNNQTQNQLPTNTMSPGTVPPVSNTYGISATGSTVSASNLNTQDINSINFGTSSISPNSFSTSGISPNNTTIPGFSTSGISSVSIMVPGANTYGTPSTNPVASGPNTSVNLPTNTVSKSIYPLEIPSINVNTKSNDSVPLSETKSANTSTNPNMPNMGNNSSGVYVDLDCFMKNINMLQNHTDNMMIDLSLLLSNIKTCSYIKKTSSSSSVSKGSSNKMDTTQLINQISSKINIPEPDVVKLKNIKADILVSDNSQILEVTKEPFSSNTEVKSNEWTLKDFVLVVILIVLLLLLIFRK